jgi:hypothetical protein
MMGHVTPGLADGVMLLEPARHGIAEPNQPVTLQVPAVSLRDLEEVAQAAVLEGNVPVHVGFAEVQRGIVRRCMIQAPAQHTQGAAGCRAVAE